MTYKHWLVIAIILGLFALNVYCNNVVIETFNYLSALPRLIAITIGVLFLLFPRFMEDLDFKKFVPNTNNISYQSFMQNLAPTPKKRRVSQTTKKVVAARQKWKCNSCKKLLDATYEIDHVTPLHQGGTNFPNNLQALCRGCHGMKTINDQLNI